MLSTFIFLRGFIGPNTERVTMNARRRIPRTPVGLIPIPEYYHPELRPVFRSGWRACERGMEIYHCPHISTDEWTVTLRRSWEYGFTECFNNRRINTDEEVYLEGWATAQLGLPLNENPHTYGSNQFNMWYIGWNDFVDNH
jgi:hypothetical protein